MHPQLKDIFSTGKVIDEKGNVYPLHSNTTAAQCEFIQSLIQVAQPENSLEIGLAYGISTLAILDALQKGNKPFHHTVVDPYQKDWKNIGLLNIERAGFSEYVTYESGFSDQVLPALYKDNSSVQFVYIDSTKVLDVLMTDVYFVTKILDVGGILVLDDCGFPGIRTLVRFLSRHPAYTIYKGFAKDKNSGTISFLKSTYFFLLGLLPFKAKVLPNYDFKSDEELGVNYDCIAFKKIKEDDRSWDWHPTF
jgi:predicted O-methyltransferase YrrM